MKQLWDDLDMCSKCLVILMGLTFLMAGCSTVSRLYQSTCECNDGVHHDAVYFFNIEKEF